MPDPSLAPIRVLAGATDGATWSVTLDEVLVNSGTAETAEAATATADLVAASCAFALSILGLSARVAPNT